MRQGNSGLNRGNGFGQSKNNGTNNRNMFVPHISANEVQHGLEKGSLVEGIVRINPKNYKDAFISSPSGITADILVIVAL
jgi:DIS3-like exonuclease 2